MAGKRAGIVGALWGASMPKTGLSRNPGLKKPCPRILGILQRVGEGQDAKDLFEPEPWRLKTYIKPLLLAGMVESLEP